VGSSLSYFKIHVSSHYRIDKIKKTKRKNLSIFQVFADKLIYSISVSMSFTHKGANNMADGLILTQEGYNKIEAEHEELVSVRRGEISANIKEAISFGDISENAEYDTAKNEQAEVEARIMKLEDMMRKAKIVDEGLMPKDRVGIGLKTKVKNLSTNEEIEFLIVGATEADPFENKISNESLVGAGLIGKKVGEIADIQVPDGLSKYEILGIYK